MLQASHHLCTQDYFRAMKLNEAGPCLLKHAEYTGYVMNETFSGQQKVKTKACHQSLRVT